MSAEERGSIISHLYKENNISDKDVDEFVEGKKYNSEMEILKIAVKTQNLMRLGLQSLNKFSSLNEPWTKESAFHSTNSLLGSSIYLTTRAVKRSKEGYNTSENIVKRYIETTDIKAPVKWFHKLLPVQVRVMKVNIELNKIHKFVT